jgi:uncharacterized protein YjdB
MKRSTHLALLSISLLSAGLALQGCAAVQTPFGPAHVVSPAQGTVSAITIAPVTSSLPPGGTQRYQATALDSNGNVFSGVEFTWHSSDKRVATVDSDGVVTAVTDGTADITATIEYGSVPMGCRGAYCSGTEDARMAITSKAATLAVGSGGAPSGASVGQR